MNAFLDYAEKQTPAAVKAQQRAAEKRRATKAEKKALAERDVLFDLWQRWRREQLEALLTGPHGVAAHNLVAFLQTMKLEDTSRLVEFVRATGWAHTDADTKFEVLSLINTTITALRERAGLLPFDDGLPGEEPGTFLIIRELFR